MPHHANLSHVLVFQKLLRRCVEHSVLSGSKPYLLTRLICSPSVSTRLSHTNTQTHRRQDETREGKWPLQNPLSLSERSLLSSSRLSNRPQTFLKATARLPTADINLLYSFIFIPSSSPSPIPPPAPITASSFCEYSELDGLIGFLGTINVKVYQAVIGGSHVEHSHACTLIG